MIKHALIVIAIILTTVSISRGQNYFFRFSPELGGISYTPAATSSNQYLSQYEWRFIVKVGYKFLNNIETGLTTRSYFTFGQLAPSKSGFGYGPYLRKNFKTYLLDFKDNEHFYIRLYPYVELETYHSNISSRKAPEFSTNSWQSLMLSPSAGINIQVTERRLLFGFKIFYDFIFEDSGFYSITRYLPAQKLEFSYIFKL